MKWRFKQTILVTLLGSTVLAGCAIPRGSEVGQEEVAGARTNAAGQMMEKIIARPTYHHAIMPIAPDGPESNIVFSETWRYYFQSESGSRKELPFLQVESGGYRIWWNWEIIAPLTGTNLWVAVTYVESASRSEEDKWDHRILYFNSSRKISERMITFSRYGAVTFDGAGNRLVNTVSMTENSVTRAIETNYYPLLPTGNDR